MKKKFFKGGGLDIDGRFIQEDVKDLVNKGLEKKLINKYNNALKQYENNLNIKQKEYFNYNENKSKENDRKTQKEINEVPKKEYYLKIFKIIYDTIKSILSSFFSTISKFFLSSGPMTHLIVFILVIIIIYYIFYGIGTAASSTINNNDTTNNENSNFSLSSLNLLSNISKKYESYKYYDNNSKFNQIIYYIPNLIIDSFTRFKNDLLYKPFYGKDIYTINASKRNEISIGRSNNVINVVDNTNNDRTNIILKPKPIEISYTNFVKNNDLINLPPEILDDNIKNTCDLTLNDKKKIYIPYTENNVGLYVLDIDNAYYTNKNNENIRLDNEEIFINKNYIKNNNIIKYPFII